jgi:hypothetical protein
MASPNHWVGLRSIVANAAKKGASPKATRLTGVEPQRVVKEILASG